MPLGRTFFALLLVASVSVGAETLRTLDGREFVGDVVSITDREIVIRAQGKEETIPTPLVLQLDIGPEGKLAGTKFIDVDFLQYDFLCSFQPVVRSVEQQCRHHNDDRRADHEKNSAHERGIQKGQAEPE